MTVLAVVSQLVSLALMRRIHRAYSAPAEDGGPHRKETEQSALSS